MGVIGSVRGVRGFNRHGFFQFPARKVIEDGEGQLLHHADPVGPVVCARGRGGVLCWRISRAHPGCTKKAEGACGFDELTSVGHSGE